MNYDVVVVGAGPQVRPLRNSSQKKDGRFFFSIKAVSLGNIIAKIHAKDYKSIGEIVIRKIRKIDGITYTSTLTGIKLY